MSKIVYIFIFIVTVLNASFISDVEILEVSNKNLEIKDIKNSEAFKRVKLPLIRHSNNDFFLKIKLDKSALREYDEIIEFNNEFNFIEFEKHLKINNTFKHPITDISKTNHDEDIYLKIHNDDGYINFYVETFVKDEYIKDQMLINNLFGITYGIIFASFLYYFALYLFNREKSYIYYSLTQLSMLCILVFVSSREVNNDRFIMDMVFFSFFIFSNLFTQHFLNTKVKAPKLHFLLNFAIVLYTLDVVSGNVFDYYFIEENFPLSTFLLLYIVAAFNVYKKGDIPILFYLLAWGLIVFSFLFIEVQFYFTQEQMIMKPIFVMHLVTPLESLILAFALSYKMKLLERENQAQQEFLTHQSKLASMGEMIGNIAHQWRQPLTHLSYILMNLKISYEKEKLTKEYFDKKSKEANKQLEYMSHTIEDFRSFFNVKKDKETFSVNKAIDEVISLLSASLLSSDIQVEINSKKDIKIESSRGEFLQVIFNIINNSKDEFIEKDIKNPKINIDLIEKNNTILIKIADNAGGIKKEIIDKVFEPYFTTKEKGLGIGLYMSKMIIDKNIGGNIKVENINDGVLFEIKIDVRT